MTSNIGSQRLLDGMLRDGKISDDVQEAIMRELKSLFRPEFLNRLDDIVFFKPLREEEILQIVDLLVEDLAKRLRERGITVELDDQAKAYIVREGFDPVYGARPLKRFIQHHLETRIGRAIIAGEVTPGSVLHVGMENDSLQVTIEDAAEDKENKDE